MKKLLFIAALFAALFTQSSVTIAQTNKPIEIELPSKVINGTKLKMKAGLFTLLYNMQSMSLTLNWKVSYYADSAGYYGQKIDLPGISTYNRESVANNTVMVDPATGAFVEKDEDGNYPEGSIGQYDFFYYLAEHQNINVHDLIRSYGAAVTDW